MEQCALASAQPRIHPIMAYMVTTAQPSEHHALARAHLNVGGLILNKGQDNLALDLSLQPPAIHLISNLRHCLHHITRTASDLAQFNPAVTQ